MWPPPHLPLSLPAASFLEAVKDVAGASPSGLGAVDKAVEAVNSLKVLGSLNKMAGLLKVRRRAGAEEPPMHAWKTCAAVWLRGCCSSTADDWMQRCLPPLWGRGKGWLAGC